MPKTRLEKENPDLFSECFDFSIGDGWMPIVEMLVLMIVRDRKQLEDDWNSALKYEDESEYWAERKPVIGEELARLTQKPVKIVQVKEKFGGLRFYMHNALPRYNEWVRYAENLSYAVCEKCGRPATCVTEGWIKNYCEEHARDSGQKWHVKEKYVRQTEDD